MDPNREFANELDRDAVRGKLDQLWGWAKQGQGDDYYVMDSANVDTFTDDVIRIYGDLTAERDRLQAQLNQVAALATALKYDSLVEQTPEYSAAFLDIAQDLDAILGVSVTSNG